MCFVLQLLNKSLYTIGANNQYSTNSPILHGSMKTPEKSLILIKYIQEAGDIKLILKINDITMADWYNEYNFAVHSDMKIHMGGLLTMGKGAIQNISKK